MKIKFFLMVLGVMAAAATDGQIAVAPEFGLNLANLAIVSSGKRLSSIYSFNNPSSRAGICAGGTVDYDIERHIYIEAGIFYDMTGAKVTQNGTNITYKINTMTIPVNVMYKFAAKTNRNYYFLGAGIYMADNLSGKLDEAGQSHSLSIGNSVVFDAIKPFDFGAGIYLGRVVKYRYMFRLHYQLGFTNLYPGGNADNSITASAFSVTIGYFVYGKKTGKKPVR